MSTDLNTTTAVTTTTVKPVVDRQAIIAGVREYAQKKGMTDGWDFVLNMKDEEIDKTMGVRTKSVLGAVQMLAMFSGHREANKTRLEAQQAIEALNGSSALEEVTAQNEADMIGAAESTPVVAPTQKAKKVTKAKTQVAA